MEPAGEGEGRELFLALLVRPSLHQGQGSFCLLASGEVGQIGRRDSETRRQAGHLFVDPLGAAGGCLAIVTVRDSGGSVRGRNIVGRGLFRFGNLNDVFGIDRRGRDHLSLGFDLGKGLIDKGIALVIGRVCR